MTPAWALRQEELLSDCIVSPDVFNPMVDRLGEFVVPFQHALETETGQRNLHLYLQGLMSHLPGKNAEDMFINEPMTISSICVDVEDQIILHTKGLIRVCNVKCLWKMFGRVCETCC